MSDAGMSDGSEAGLTFAVADLHGRYDLLELALSAIERRGAHDGNGARTVVFLGDYVDRGPHSCAILDRLMTGPSENWRWVCLRGNHEAMMAMALRDADRLDSWIANGGDTTVASYRDTPDRIGRHLAWIEGLASIHLDRHRVYVHAGVDPMIPLGEQQDKILLWKRYPPGFGAGHGDRHVVHGHDPNTDGPLFHAGRTDLDTLAWATGRLVIGVFDDRSAGGPIETIEVRSTPTRLTPTRFRDGRSATA